MAAIDTEMKPPVTVVGPIAWLRKNLFSTWYNILLTLLAAWLLVSMLRPAVEWALTEARWGVIEANLQLFMIGLYPRDQVWRVWLVVDLLFALIGLSWGVWKNAVRGFAFIALGAGAAFIIICLLYGWLEWMNWVIAMAALLAMAAAGRFVPRGTTVAVTAWLLYLPLVFLLVGGSRFIPFLPPVAMSLWSGLLLTMLLTVVGIFGSLPLGILLAFGRHSQLPVVRYFSIGYIELIRGVPLITILYMSDILLPLFLPADFRPDRVLRAMVGLV